MPATTNKLPGDMIPRKESPSPARRGGCGKGKEATVVPERRSPGNDYEKWRSLVERIQSGDERGMEELYSVFSKGIRYYLCRQLGPQEFRFIPFYFGANVCDIRDLCFFHFLIELIVDDSDLTPDQFWG